MGGHCATGQRVEARRLGAQQVGALTMRAIRQQDFASVLESAVETTFTFCLVTKYVGCIIPSATHSQFYATIEWSPFAFGPLAAIVLQSIGERHTFYNED